MCSGAPLPYYLYVQAHISKTFGLPPAQVYKDECMFSFATPLSTGGLYVNLATWQAYSAAFVGLDHERTGNALYLWEEWHKVRPPMLPRFLREPVAGFRSG